MATRAWLGAAVAVAEVKDFVFAGTWLAAETVTVTIGNKSLVLTVGTGQVDLDEIANDVADMINGNSANGTESRSALGSNVNEFHNVSAESDGTDTVRVTGPDSGKPISVSMTTDSSSGTITPSTIATATGPEFLDNTDNWSGGAVPVDDDDVVFDHRAASSCLYGLDELDDVTPTSITVNEGFRHAIGLADVNTDIPSKPYDEYLETYLTFCASADSTDTKVTINAPQASRIRLDTQDGQASILVSKTGYRDGQVPAMMWKGTHASNSVVVISGDFGAAIGDGDSATISSLSVNAGATVTCGDGCTLTTVNNYGGTLETQSNVTTLTQSSGQTRHKSGRGTAATMGTVTVNGGVLYYESTGTLTTLVVTKGGKVDCRNDPSARTFTNISLYAGSEFHDPQGTVTATNGFDLVQCSPIDVVFDVQSNKTWTPTTI